MKQYITHSIPFTNRRLMVLAATMLLAAVAATAQQVANPENNIPDGSSLPGGTVTYPGLSNLTPPGVYNYIRTYIPDRPMQSLSGTYIRQSTDYFDGLGRVLQTVEKNAHAQGHDIVQYHVYDSLGRESYQYLPYIFQHDPNTFNTSGWFHPSVLNNVQGFYSDTPSEQPYRKADYERSALQRPTKELAPGRSWVGSDRGTTYSYRQNMAGEVRLWTIGAGTNIVEATDFNDGTMPGWYNYGNTTLNVENQRLKVSVSGQWQGILRTFNVIPGRQYKVILDIDKGNVASSLSLTLLYADSWTPITSNTVNQSTNGVNMTFTPTASPVALVIETTGPEAAGRAFYIDNYRLEDLSGSPTGNSTAPVSATTYAPGELKVTTITDEDGNRTIQYHDKQDKLILVKAQVAAGSPDVTGHSGFACTYYVYDDLGQRRFVLPPEAVNQRMENAGTWSFTQNVISGLCFKYTYDERGRQIERKIPGKGMEYFVYDLRDRLIMYQDGNLKADGNKWRFTFYDALDRPTVTAWAYPDADRQVLQNIINQNNPVSDPNHYLYYFVNYDLMYAYFDALPFVFVLSHTYYDHYSQLSGFSFDADQFGGIGLPTDGTVVPSVLNQVTRGLLTGKKVRITDPDNPTASNWLSTAYYYDDYGRVIQSQSQNIKGGLDISSSIYYFQGKPWKNILRHNNPAALPIPGTTDGAKTTLTIQKTYTLGLTPEGGSDLLNSITQKIDSGIVYQMANYYYDHLGRIVARQWPAANVLQEYNMRGFLNHLQYANFNNNPANGDPDPHIFEEKLYYDIGFASKLYNGNIAGITWRKAGATAPVEAYGYGYDKLSRLTHAEYRRQNLGTTAWSKAEVDYTASGITYDGNGNILTMKQRGVDLAISSSPIDMDRLFYQYAAGSNQLMKVTDTVPASGTPSLPDFKDKANLQVEYSYDVNGNLITDANKQITSIAYTIDNKPEKITIQNQGTITYIHDGEGNLLQRKVYNSSTNTTEVYDYIGNFVYKDNLLQYILNEEGRARPIASNSVTRFIYDYFVKDHLGNVRSTVTANPINQAYLATHEISMANVEQLFFDNIPNVQDGKPGSSDPGDSMAARLNGSEPDRRIGTAIMLKTMPGDRFTVSADTYYEGEYQQQDNVPVADMVSSLMSALLNGNTYAGVPISELPDNVRTIKQVLENPALPGQIDQMLTTANDPDAPKAHLNVLFFDSKMQLIPGASAIKQVPVINTGQAGSWQVITPASSTGPICCMTQDPGFVIIFVDNQSIGKDVWFDNITIGHYTSSILSEEHFYPYGLSINVSQSGNASIPANNYLFGTKELEKSLGLNWYDFIDRPYDMQTGRWPTQDRKAEKYYEYSPYAYAIGNPVAFVDPDGQDPIYFNKFRYTGGWTDYLKTIPNAAISIGQAAMDITWNSADANIQSIQRGTWLQDIGNELKSYPGQFSSLVSNSVDYAVNTPITQQVKDAVSPEAVESMLAFTATVAAGSMKMPEVNIGFSRMQSTAGPLPLRIAETFKSSNYEAVTLKKPTVLSKYYDNSIAFAKGRYMTESVTGIKFIDRMGLALKPSWNKMTNIAKWEIPAGSTVYKGNAAMQFPWIGGKSQYYIPNEVLNNSKQIK